ncbi:MAG: sigma-70 family RNA polymerase sigma factor, partial [Aquificaceae bacterium]|nr:sigma-70 family RNA polymerase sigma factor [Aquificaceae bacterium]
DFASRNLRSREKTIRRAMEKLSMEKGKETSDEELAHFLGVSQEKLTEELQAISFSYLLSLDEMFQEGRSYDELFESKEEGPEETVIKSDLREKLLKAIEKLDEREKLVLQLLYYEDIPLKEVAKLLGVSIARVSQIKASAIEKLKALLSSAL